MKRLIAMLALILPMSGTGASPTSGNLSGYVSRMNFFIATGKTPDEVATALNAQFGSPYGGKFLSRSNGAALTTDIIYQEGDANTITFYATLGTMKNKD